jgi:SPP1 family predicted phage head-tail adaptor
MAQQGNKTRQIDFYVPTVVIDGANEPDGSDPWVLYATRWAEIKGETGMGRIRAEASAGGVNTPLNRYSFRINYDKTIDTTMQVRTPEGDRLNVLSVLHDLARRTYSDIVCEMGGSNG